MSSLVAFVSDNAILADTKEREESIRSKAPGLLQDDEVSFSTAAPQLHAHVDSALTTLFFLQHRLLYLLSRIVVVKDVIVRILHPNGC